MKHALVTFLTTAAVVCSAAEDVRMPEDLNQPQTRAVSTDAGPNWGREVNPDGDCKFYRADGSLLIHVPGAPRPHDLAAELHTVNAPRVVRPVKGDFTVQVKIEGRFAPGDASTLGGRAGYNGAGIVLMSDARNVVCLARAVFHHQGAQATPYANFEMRSNGNLVRMGLSGDLPVPASGPVYLRLERRGQRILGAVSKDGSKWDSLEPKELPSHWPADLQVGVIAISTSKEEFNPRFSDFQILK